MSALTKWHVVPQQPAPHSSHWEWKCKLPSLEYRCGRTHLSQIAAAIHAWVLNMVWS